MQLVEKHNIKKGSQYYEILDHTCFLSKNLYNATLYQIRQEFINNGKFINYYTLQKKFQDEKQPDYCALPSKVSQQVMKSVNQAFKSFFNANKSYKKDKSKFNGKPKITKYKDKKNGRYMLKYTYQAISKTILENEGLIKLSGLEVYIKTNLKYNDICEVRVIPKINSYMVEVVYNKKEIPEKGDNGLYAAIDLGVDNFATMVSNKEGFNPIILDGRKAKSYNRLYNKELSKKKSILEKRNKKKTSKSIKKLTEKRNNRLNDFIHKASRHIVNQLVSNSINTLIVGHNKEWKQDINIGRVNNQNFIELPHSEFIKKLIYKCKLVGIKLIEQEESYTSKCSFLDNEEVCKHDEYAGKRIKRGLFKSNNGTLINADVNGAYNILRKCMPKIYINGVEGAVVHPVRHNIDKKVSM